MKFQPGDRVRISDKNHWAKGAHGVIAEPPEFAQQLVQNSFAWERWHRLAQGANRLIEFYWVSFDEPQVDADNDGPYTGGEIDAEMIDRS